jgi:hypothetical protein
MFGKKTSQFPLGMEASQPFKQTQAQKAAEPVRPKSAYNMYMKEQFTMAKEAGGSSVSGQWAMLSAEEKQVYVGSVAGQWAMLSAEEKQVYNDQAAEANANLVLPPLVLPPPKQRRVTGYHLFFRENKDMFKTPAAPVEEGALGVSTMEAVGNAWKAMSKEEQEVWNVLAKNH